jgi:hypothetical protein
MSAIILPEVTTEVQRFFEAFATAFSEFDGALIARRYAVPYLALNAEGVLQSFGTQAHIAVYFQGYLDQYHQQGCRACRFKDLHVVPLGQHSALATITWELLRSDCSIASSWRESYNLTRLNQELRIYTSTDHVAPA